MLSVCEIKTLSANCFTLQINVSLSSPLKKKKIVYEVDSFCFFWLIWENALRALCTPAIVSRQ